MFARGLQLIALAAMVAAAGMTAPAPAQEKGPFGGFKHDSTAPIEIVADSLEVRQAENLAIFSGEVVAGQGTLRLTTDLLTVTYAAEESDTGTDTNSRVGTGEIRFLGADTLDMQALSRTTFEAGEGCVVRLRFIPENDVPLGSVGILVQD